MIHRRRHELPVDLKMSTTVSPLRDVRNKYNEGPWRKTPVHRSTPVLTWCKALVQRAPPNVKILV